MGKVSDHPATDWFALPVAIRDNVPAFFKGLRMAILLFIFIGLLFTAFAALIFSAMTLALGKVFQSFEVTGPDDWTFGQFYLRYLIIAAVFTFVTIPASYILGVCAMTLAYKFVFDAGWLQAVVIGAIGGTIALVLFLILLIAVLVPLGMAAAM